jgi:hypothetical protein
MKMQICCYPSRLPWTCNLAQRDGNRSHNDQSLAEWPILEDKMEVKSFLGLASYYR